jgi:hypothetical protein
MQSVFKLGESGNAFKLGEPAGSDPDVGSGPSREAKKPAAADPSPKKETGSPGSEKEAAPMSAAAAPADDALAWLKIIEKATADLTADVWASKSSAVARPIAPDDDPETSGPRPAPLSSGRSQANTPRANAYDEGGWHDKNSEHGEERKLAQKLSYRYAEPRYAPPQSLRSALVPYIAATSIFAFLAGSAVVYFATGSSSSDVKANVAAPSIDAQLDSWMSRPDQVSSKKTGLQRALEPSPAPVQRVSEPRTFELPAAPVRTMVMESAESAGEKAQAPQQVQTWSDTVETFKQFVKPDQNAR